IAVGGTTLASYPLMCAGIPHLVWCASTMIADRVDRRAAMPVARRLLDRFIVGSVQRAMEKKILSASTQIMAVSSYTRDTLIKAGGNSENISRVPIPVDVDRFHLPSTPADTGVIGFAGRPGDPRKNLGLLFGALKRLLDQGQSVTLRLTGDEPSELSPVIRRLGISDHITWTGWLDDDALPEFYRGLDIFVIPSLQEGLNIAGVQAMASGVPVVSTRSGGPEDYVIDGETGQLVGFDEKDMAMAIGDIVSSRQRRDEMSAKARAFAVQHYGRQEFADGLAAAWQQTWGETP
ncbi:MAG: glycosyltransferase family 4 protein, partial [Rhodospirillaceae bacterium]|nr:glycosyltransferase family 4 protein [Rhodospirillaceae bacterium]